MKLRSKDLKFAKSTKHLDDFLDVHRGELTPKQVISHATKELKKLGYRLKKKNGPKSWKFKRMATTGKRTVWLGVDWNERTPSYQGATLMHELVHARQRLSIARYIADARYRFAIEAQAYRETCRAYRAMGASEKVVRAYAADLPGRFIKSYWILGRRMRQGVHRHMRAIVLRTFNPRSSSGRANVATGGR